VIRGLRPLSDSVLDRLGRDPYCCLYLPLWKLDGDSSITKDAPGLAVTNHGSVWTPKGRVFDGDDDYLTVAHNSRFNFGSDDFTIVLFISKPSFIDENNHTLGHFGPTGSLVGWYFAMQYGTTEQGVDKDKMNFRTNNNQCILAVDHGMTAGRMHMITIRNHNTDFTMARDMNILGSAVLSSVQDVTHDIWIATGDYTGHESHMLDATVPLVLIHNRALSPVEELDCYRAGKELFA